MNELDPRVEAAAQALNRPEEYVYGMVTPWERLDESFKGMLREKARVALAAAGHVAGPLDDPHYTGMLEQAVDDLKAENERMREREAELTDALRSAEPLCARATACGVYLRDALAPVGEGQPVPAQQFEAGRIHLKSGRFHSVIAASHPDDWSEVVYRRRLDDDAHVGEGQPVPVYERVGWMNKGPYGICLMPLTSEPLEHWVGEPVYRKVTQ